MVKIRQLLLQKFSILDVCKGPGDAFAKEVMVFY